MTEKTRRMLEIAQTVSPEVVCQAAEKFGWKLLQVGRADAKFYRLPEPEDTQVIVPLIQSYADYPNRILTAVHYFAEAQDRTMSSVLDELAEASAAASGTGSPAPTAPTTPTPVGTDSVSEVVT